MDRCGCTVHKDENCYYAECKDSFYVISGVYLISASCTASILFLLAGSFSVTTSNGVVSLFNCSWLSSIPFTSFSLFSSPSGSNRASNLLPSSILSKRLSLPFDAIRSVRHSLLARASISNCFSSSVFAKLISKSSSPMGPLNDSAVGIVYLEESDVPSRHGKWFSPLGILQLFHSISITSVCKKLEIQRSHRCRSQSLVCTCSLCTSLRFREIKGGDRITLNGWTAFGFPVNPVLVS